jgi:hypothetical protein
MVFYYAVVVCSWANLPTERLSRRLCASHASRVTRRPFVSTLIIALCILIHCFVSAIHILNKYFPKFKQ